MLDEKTQNKFLAEATEAAEETEELFRTHAKAILDRGNVMTQVRSYRRLSQEVDRCRQLSGFLEAEKLEYDKDRFEKIIEAFDALKEPKLERFSIL